MAARPFRPLLTATMLTLSMVFAGGAAASAIPDYPFIHTSGSSTRWAMPDTAALDFEVVAADADPAAARAVLEARVEEARALARELGIPAEEFVVQEVVQNTRKNEQAATGGPVYELRCYVNIKLRDVTKWPALAGGLLGKPNLTNFASTFDTSALAALESELMQEAIAEARHRAEVMAESFGARIGGVAGATPAGLKSLGRVMGLEADELRGRPGGAIRSTTRVGDKPILTVPLQRWQQYVDVVFRVEPAPRAAKRTK